MPIEVRMESQKSYFGVVAAKRGWAQAHYWGWGSITSGSANRAKK